MDVLCKTPSLPPACTQLLININFNQKVKINGIGIKAKEDDPTAPKTIKLYANRASMGFSDTDSVPSSQDLVLTPAQLNGEPLPLKLVKFTNVLMLSVFIEGNQGGEDVTRLSKVVLYGSAGEVFNVAAIKKQEEGQ